MVGCGCCGRPWFNNEGVIRENCTCICICRLLYMYNKRRGQVEASEQNAFFYIFKFYFRFLNFWYIIIPFEIFIDIFEDIYWIVEI